MSTVMVSERGAFELACEEDLVPSMYYDQAGVETFGIGHTNAAGAPFVGSLPQSTPPAGVDRRNAVIRAWQIFLNDLDKYTDAVIAVLGTGLEQHELDGWVKWHFNTGGIRQTSAVKKWKAGDKAGAVRILKQWNKITVKGKKKVSKGLVSRRVKEADMILNGLYPNGTLEVYGVNAKNQVIWKPLASYNFKQWAEYTIFGDVKPRIGAAPAVAYGGGAVGIGALIVAFWDNIAGLLGWG